MSIGVHGGLRGGAGKKEGKRVEGSKNRRNQRGLGVYNKRDLWYGRSFLEKNKISKKVVPPLRRKQPYGGGWKSAKMNRSQRQKKRNMG